MTDKHPEQDGTRVAITPENYRTFARGHVAEDVHQDGDFVASTLLIQDADLIAKIEAGERRELSCGYTCDLELAPGRTEEGEAYDAIQRSISHNHVALGPSNWGRAGGEVQLRLDSNEAFQTEEKHMKETIDGKEYVIGSPEWGSALKASRDAALRRADAADPKSIAALVVRRTTLLSRVARVARRAKVAFDAAEAAGMGEENLIAKAIQQLHPDFDPAGRSPDNLAGYFECLVRDLGSEAEEDNEPTDDDRKALANEQKMPEPPNRVSPEESNTRENPMGRQDSKVFAARRGLALVAPHADDNGPNPDKARAEMISASRNAWKGTVK